LKDEDSKTLTIEDLRKVQKADKIFKVDEQERKKYFEEVSIKSELKSFLSFELIESLKK
jgi:hypothetical protein